LKPIRLDVGREEVLRFYVGYDCRKKKIPVPPDLGQWDYRDPRLLDIKLRQHQLKPGVVAAYKVWSFVELATADLLDCAIVKDVFKNQPQALSRIPTSVLAGWTPNGRPEWFDALKRGDPFPSEWAMIMRPSTVSEHPAKWYIEDGTGRALCLLQRNLTDPGPRRVAYAYVGLVADKQSEFFASRPELLRPPQPG
jgi:hypothetical protein